MILQGKFSYIVAALTIIGAGAGYLMGSLDSVAAIQMALGGLAVFGIRRAIK